MEPRLFLAGWCIGIIAWCGVGATVQADDGLGAPDPAVSSATSIPGLPYETAGEMKRLPPVDSPEAISLSGDFLSASTASEVLPASGVEPAVPGSAGDEFYTMDELRAEMKKLVWTKGDYKIVPYGILWGTSVYETARSNNGDYTLWVYSLQDEGEDAFHVDGRNSRLGVDVTGPKVPFFGSCCTTGGKVEVDFQGLGGTENRGTLLLRHAYLEMKDDNSRYLLGQTWDVISPLYPGMLLYSIGWLGGNIGYRRAQARGEQYFDHSDHMRFILQGSLNTDLTNDAFFVDATDAGQHAGWPVLEGRAAVMLGERGPKCRPIELGFSAHIGELIYDFDPANDDVARKTWSCNVDLRVPITSRLGVQAELFTGENLSTYFGGIGQGINNVTRQGIQSRGGWVDVWYDWTPRLHSHVGYSIDDPFNEDLQGMAANARVYNAFTFANLTYDVTPKFLIGFEVSDWNTHYLNERPGESVRFEFAAKYGF